MRLNRAMESSLIPLYMYIINKLLSEGFFADSRKKVLINPLLKRPRMDLVKKNYRTVSNLLALSKLVEAKAI